MHERHVDKLEVSYDVSTCAASDLWLLVRTWPMAMMVSKATSGFFDIILQKKVEKNDRKVEIYGINQ